MCKVLKVTPGAFYAWLKRPESNRSKENRRLESKIRFIHRKSNDIFGSPKIHDALKSQGEACGVNRVAGIMKRAGIKSRIKRKFKVTTDSGHNYPIAPNLLDQHFETSEPNRIWVADITYIWTLEGWLYLATLMDLFSRRIVGWSMSNRMTQTLTIDALTMAISNRKNINGLIHHSDRGSQYAATAYQQILKNNGILCSMSRKGNCYDNAVMESFFHSLK
jgi:transposase InsO family protein